MHRRDETPVGEPVHTFRVWAPEKERMILHITAPFDARLEMHRPGVLAGHADENTAGGMGGASGDRRVTSVDDGYFELEVHGAGPGTRYAFTLEDGRDAPDPASHFQPEGVFGPSEVVDHDRYHWRSGFGPDRPFAAWVIYELHVGAFTPEGTFAAAIARLDDLAALGVTAIELMPVNQCPGTRNWGYDGVFLYAVQNTLGGPDAFKAFVDACHARGLAVILDVVYNHWGPEGASALRFGPYTTEAVRTPWGDAVNLDGPWSDGVRDFICENMKHWFLRYRVDALRVDAVHAIFDHGARPFWAEVRARVDAWRAETGRPLRLIAECDLNSPRVITGVEAGGLGFDAQWLDDFHHALYTLVHPEGRTHYRDFGSVAQFAKAYAQGFVHTGEFVSFRRKRYGASSAGIPGDRFVVFGQNHDQIGNRIGGERLSVLVDPARLKLSAAAVLLAPYVPLLFMGEEYGETAPFHFFADYEDADLARRVREGRLREFEAFEWGGGEPADPGAPETFAASKLRWETRERPGHAALWAWHRALLALRRSHHALRYTGRDGIGVEVVEDRGLLVSRRVPPGLVPAAAADDAGSGDEVVCLFNFSDRELTVSLPPGRAWIKRLDARAPDLIEEGPVGTTCAPPWGAQVFTAPPAPASV